MPGHTILQKMEWQKALWGQDEVTKICGGFDCKSKIRAEIWKAELWWIIMKHPEESLKSSPQADYFFCLNSHSFFFPSSLFDWHIPHRSTPSFGLLNTHISNTSSMKNISQLRGGAYHRVTWISKVLVLGWGAKEVQKSYESFLHFLLSWSDWSLSTYYDLRVEKCCHNWPVKFPFNNLMSSTGQLLLQYPVLQTSSKNRSWKQYTEWCHFHFFPTNVFHIMNTMNMTHLRKGYLQSEGSSKQRSWKSYSNQGVSEH